MCMRKNRAEKGDYSYVVMAGDPTKEGQRGRYYLTRSWEIALIAHDDYYKVIGRLNNLPDTSRTYLNNRLNLSWAWLAECEMKKSLSNYCNSEGIVCDLYNIL